MDVLGRWTSGRGLEKLQQFTHVTRQMAALSTCKRAKVGCILVSPGYRSIQAIGYNGPPVGMPNESCVNVEGDCGCVHAELNALLKLRGRWKKELLMITSFSPCFKCAQAIVNSETVEMVAFIERYREAAGRSLLKEAGVHLLKVC